MQLWRFLQPSVLGFTLRTGWQQLVDRLRNAPPRPVQAADYVAAHARRGDPADVLRTIDRFARNQRWLMNIGPDKGPLVQELAGRLPADARILEIGAYCGYSAIMLASAFGLGAQVTSLEISPVAVALSTCEVPVRDLTLRTPTLDDVFLELTGNRIEPRDDRDLEEER